MQAANNNVNVGYRFTVSALHSLVKIYQRLKHRFKMTYEWISNLMISRKPLLSGEAHALQHVHNLPAPSCLSHCREGALSSLHDAAIVDQSASSERRRMRGAATANRSHCWSTSFVMSQHYSGFQSVEERRHAAGPVMRLVRFASFYSLGLPEDDIAVENLTKKIKVNIFSWQLKGRHVSNCSGTLGGIFVRYGPLKWINF